MMALDPDLALKLEVSIYADEFRNDLHRLLDITGAKLQLGWHGLRNAPEVVLCLVVDGRREPLAVHVPERQAWSWLVRSERTRDFHERFSGLLGLHRAKMGLGIHHTKGIARFNVCFPNAPRGDDGQILSLRLIYTRRGHYGEYVPPPAEGTPA
jgi:hypothetical protein